MSQECSLKQLIHSWLMVCSKDEIDRWKIGADGMKLLFLMPFNLRTELLDGESFNYASKNDRLHKLLNSSPSKNLIIRFVNKQKKVGFSVRTTKYFNRHPNVSPMILGLLLFLALHFLFFFIIDKEKEQWTKKSDERREPSMQTRTDKQIDVFVLVLVVTILSVYLIRNHRDDLFQVFRCLKLFWKNVALRFCSILFLPWLEFMV